MQEAGVPLPRVQLLLLSAPSRVQVIYMKQIDIPRVVDPIMP